MQVVLCDGVWRIFPWTNWSCPKLGKRKSATNVDDIGNVLVVLRDLDPNDSICFVEEL